MFKYFSKTSQARPKSNSMRVTIPKEVAKFLKLNIGDEVEFNVEFIDDKNINVNLLKKEE